MSKHLAPGVVRHMTSHLDPLPALILCGSLSVAAAISRAWWAVLIYLVFFPLLAMLNGHFAHQTGPCPYDALGRPKREQ